MPSKTEEYLALAQRTANGLTRYWESWTDYLTTASRLYKYPFSDQLMIYAQRPDATACADFDIWNNRMNRYVRRGAKGIALLDESSGFPRLHYVFDVSDTGVRRNSRDPEVWQLGPDLVQPVSEMLSKTYGISGERVSQQLADVAGKLVADYWDNNSEDISAIVDGSLLMDYDEAGVEMQFKSAAAISVTYTLLERCGIEPAGWFDKDDFQAIYNFSTPDSVYALGAAVSDMSREVLRNIERTVKTTIRRRNAERSQYEYEQQERDLLDRRGLPAPEPDPEPAPEAAGQVRQAAPDVSDEPSPGAVQLDAPEREPVPASDGGGADGREPDAADHGAVAETDPGPGQGAESDGVGAAHEQPESASRGTGTDGTDLQLSFFDAHIPTEAEQIETIDRAESEKTPSAFVLSQAEIENELRRHGSGFAGGKQRIMALYQTQPDRKLRAKALAKEYGIGGHSHDFLDGSRGFANHDWKGLEYAAQAWICQNQLGRRNLDPERRKFLMGKAYENEKLSIGAPIGNQNGLKQCVQNEHIELASRTCEKIAKRNGVAPSTVRRADRYAKGVDAAETAVPGAMEEILSGHIKATDAEITALAKMPKEEIPAIIEELRKPKQERQAKSKPPKPEKVDADNVPVSSKVHTEGEITPVSNSPPDFKRSIQGHKRCLTDEDRKRLRQSIDNRHHKTTVANGSIMMCEVQGAKEDFIRRWNLVFKDYPDVFEDNDCRSAILSLIDDTSDYLQTIKERVL